MKTFVSYAQKNRGVPELRCLRRDLERLGCDVWIDEKLVGGVPWWSELLSKIRDSDVFVFVITDESLDSKPCQAELGWAAANHRRILPVKIGAIPDWRIPEPLVAAQIIDYSGRNAQGDAAVECLLDLRTSVDRLSSEDIPPAPDPAPPAPSIPFPTAVRLQVYLDADTLPLPRQEEFLREVKLHQDDVDSDLMSIVGVLKKFRSRRDIAYSVALDVDRLVEQLSSEPERVGHERRDIGTPPGRNEPAGAGTGVETDRGDADAGVAGAADGGSALRGGKTQLHRFPAHAIDLDALTRSLAGWYESQKLETQTRRDGARRIVQCRSRSWRRMIGAGAALTVVLWTDGDELAVEIGGSQWLDKAAAGAVAWFVVWPAIIPAAIGGVKQATLPSHTLRYIESIIPTLTSRSAT